ncbi:hypothetical protein [Aurantibacillus circumpalustris]|uniref:hypothetical protein n=1 Tax=Aurantibacillus circumpalustris TaxID=3036359 RepID=UPI00295B1405|nr:hypothetical protein [Aurantibacillus circumpalustris]
MRLLKISFLIGFLALTFYGCKNDLKLNAPYKEYPSIYAVLNPNEEVQMIRVNKVFLSETDANDVAKIADSVNYQPNEITVSLNHSTKPEVPIVFGESMVTTQDGAFSTSQRVYVSPKDFKLEISGTYTLTVKNNNTGNIFTATTTAIGQISQSQTSSLFSPPFYPYADTIPPAYYIDYSKTNQKYNIRFTPNEGTIYKVTVRFHFYDSLYNTSRVNRFVDFPSLNMKKMANQDIQFPFTGADVYSGLGLALSKLKLDKDIEGRKMYKIEYIINSTTQEYQDYLQYSLPSLSINQNKPLYSNFKDGNALGIFTFRTTFTLSKNPSTVYVNSFSSNSNTCNYKFYDSQLNLIGCN